MDIYKIGNDIIEFYFITTRQRVKMEVDSSVFTFISGIDGKNTLGEICDAMEIKFEDEQLHVFLKYLVDTHILFLKEMEDKAKLSLSFKDLARYDRQLNYFNSYRNISPYDFQKTINKLKFAIFGCGAIGSGIAIQLLMAGVRNFILIDKDVVSKDSVERHFFFSQTQIGRPKVDALSDYLITIDSEVVCENHLQVIDFNTPIESLLFGVDFVINTMDEPYIGFTSMKIGRLCYKKKLPLYVGGGFDAHLMSTGELIVPDITPCVDCYVSYFTSSLKNWKPKYNIEAIPNKEKKNGHFEVGGLASMSLFSISYAVTVILNYLATGDAASTKGRGELLLDQLHIQYLHISKDPNCNVCGHK